MIVCIVYEFAISIDVLISSVRKAYKKKALETHPDRLGPNVSEMRREIAQVQFQKVFKPVVRCWIYIHIFKNINRSTRRSTFLATVRSEGHVHFPHVNCCSHKNFLIQEYDASLLKATAMPSRKVEPRENEEQVKRMKDRMEWVQQQRKRDEERIATMKAKETELKDAQERGEREANMAKEFLQELFSLSPEWEERRRRVHQVRPCYSKYNPHVNPGCNCNSKGHNARSKM